MSLPMQEITVRARAAGVSFGVSSKGNYQIAVQCVVVDDEQYNGESIAWIGHFTEKTQARTIESLQYLGFAGDDLSELEDADEERCAALLPNVVELVCAPEEYDGQWTLKVKWVNRPGAGRFSFKDKLEGSALKAFAAQMKGSLKNARGGSRPSKPNGNGQRQTQPHPNAPGSGYGGTPPDDDIPF